ncbi:hypothetical protein KM043_005395 [Ampulex compressa]|nr:hypothetical protein KM043_005395 [Ampulex compressa]
MPKWNPDECSWMERAAPELERRRSQPFERVLPATSRLRNNKVSFAMHWKTFSDWLNRRLSARSFARVIAGGINLAPHRASHLTVFLDVLRLGLGLRLISDAALVSILSRQFISGPIAETSRRYF